jgi:hypothetical protein
MKLKIFGLIIVALTMAACNAVENQSTSGSLLQIVSLTDQNTELPVFSDVSTYINDIGMADINALPLDPLLATTAITSYYDVLIDQIDVKFKRTDGRNVEGVDVPYSFTQPMAFLVPINGNAKIPFNLIRHMAKIEPPLLALREEFPNQGKMLQLIALVTFHGKDLGGHRVAPVTGYISVWCSSITPGAAIGMGK